MNHLYNRPLLIAREEFLRAEISQPVQDSVKEEMIGDTLVIHACGIIEQKSNLSLDKICALIRGIGPDVTRVIFDFDTPGGSVDGIQALTALIKEKIAMGIRFIALVNPLCCSGGYWIASACGEVYLSSSTARLGSVGVLAIHEDISKKDELEGRKITEIVAGKYKRIDTEHKPLTPEGRAILQAQVDYIYHLFVNEVSQNRKIAIERVIGEIGDGRIFIGQQAISLGLADGIFTLEQVIKGENMLVQTNQTQNPQAAPKALDEMMEMQRLMKENEDLKKQIEELKKQIPSQEQQTAMLDKEKQCAAMAERNRIKALEEIAPTSCQALLSQAKNEGWTVEKASIEFLKSQKSQAYSNPLRNESTVVQPMLAQSNEDEQSALAKRMAQSVNQRKVRS